MNKEHPVMALEEVITVALQDHGEASLWCREPGVRIRLDELVDYLRKSPSGDWSYDGRTIFNRPATQWRDAATLADWPEHSDTANESWLEPEDDSFFNNVR